jgi:hypothetical protein
MACCHHELPFHRGATSTNDDVTPSRNVTVFDGKSDTPAKNTGALVDGGGRTLTP